jgi:hypothetical protein
VSTGTSVPGRAGRGKVEVAPLGLLSGEANGDVRGYHVRWDNGGSKPRSAARRWPLEILLGIAVLALGLLYAFAPDLMWELQHLSNSLDGQVSERTEAWEWKRKFAAGFMLVLAVLMFVIAFTG